MWGIGIKKEYNIEGEYVSLTEGIVNEESLVKKFLMLFGLKLKIWEKKYKSNYTIRENKKVGY